VAAADGHGMRAPPVTARVSLPGLMALPSAPAPASASASASTIPLRAALGCNRSMK
jgi:hypothetical protein